MKNKWIFFILFFSFGILNAQKFEIISPFTGESISDKKQCFEAVEILAKIIDKEQELINEKKINSEKERKQELGKFMNTLSYSKFNLATTINHFKYLCRIYEDKGIKANSKIESLDQDLKKSSSKYSAYTGYLIEFNDVLVPLDLIFNANSSQSEFPSYINKDFIPTSSDKINLKFEKLELSVLKNLLEILYMENIGYNLEKSQLIYNEYQRRNVSPPSVMDLYKSKYPESTLISSKNSKNEDFSIAMNFLYQSIIYGSFELIYNIEKLGYQSDLYIEVINDFKDIVKNFANTKKLKTPELEKLHALEKSNSCFSPRSPYVISYNGIVVSYDYLMKPNVKFEELNLGKSITLDNIPISTIEKMIILAEREKSNSEDNKTIERIKILKEEIEKRESLSKKNNSSSSNQTNPSNSYKEDSQSNFQTKVFSDGIFWGEVVGDKREGQGTYYYNEGHLYEGNYSNDLKNGLGTFYFSNGDRYEGNWVNDKRNGQGTYFFNNGDRFVGTFADGKTTENGTYSYKVDKRGCVSGDCINGFGKKVFTNAVYEGNFKNGKENGQGKMIYPNKTYYEGSWQDGQKHGKGKQTWYYGDSYDGDWVNGKRSGNGIYVWGRGKYEGDKYEGAFYEDKRTGWGKYTYAKTGETKEGNYESDVYKGTELQRIQSVSSTNSSVTQNSTNNNSSPYNCIYNPTKPTGLTYELVDNRIACCYCEKYYAKHTLNDDYKTTEEVAYLCEILTKHLIESKIGLVDSDNSRDETDIHREEDMKKLSDYISVNYGPLYSLSIAYIPLLPLSYAMSTLYGGKREFGVKQRKIEKYKITDKFCSNECKTKCEFYGCKTCN
jgi:hypothetical protein